MPGPTTGKLIRLADNDERRFTGYEDTTGKLTLKDASVKSGFSTWTIRNWTQTSPPRLVGHMLPVSIGSAKKCIWVDELELMKVAETRKTREHTSSNLHLHWTREERERVAEEFAVLRLTEPLAIVSELVRRAQESGLPVDRRKKNVMLANEPVLRKLIIEKWDVALQSTAPADPVIIREPKIEPILDIARSLEEAPLEELCGVAMRRYVKSVTSVDSRLCNFPPVQSALVPHIEAPTSPTIVSRAEEKVSAKKSKYKIAILGLFRQQFEDLNNKVQYDDLELVHVPMVKDKSPGSCPPSVDFVLCSKFIGHAGWEKAQSEMGFDRVRMVRGGLSNIQAKIVEVRSQLIARNGRS